MTSGLWAFGDRMTFALTGQETDGQAFVMEQIVPRHTRPPGRHRHANEDHIWYGIELLGPQPGWLPLPD